MEDIRALNRRLVAASYASDGAYYRWALRSGVTEHTLSLLYALDDGLPHSQKQISEEWGIPKTTVNTVVKACRQAGYLRLDAMPGQPRERQVCLTEEGHAYAARVLEELYRAEDAAMAEAASRFGPGFVEALECFSRPMRAALEGPPGKSEKDGSDPHGTPII